MIFQTVVVKVVVGLVLNQVESIQEAYTSNCQWLCYCAL